MESTEVAIKAIAIGTLIWVVILQLIASKLIKRVLPLFHTLQCIILIKLFKLNLPGNVNNLLQIIIDTIEMKQVKEYGGQLAEESDVKNAAIFKKPILLVACVGIPVSLLIIGLLALTIYLIKLHVKQEVDLTDKQKACRKKTVMIINKVKSVVIFDAPI